MTLCTRSKLSLAQLQRNAFHNFYYRTCYHHRQMLTFAPKSRPVSVIPTCSFHTASTLANNSQERTVVLPPLMNFPRLMWPRFFLTIQNYVYAYIIRTYMDAEFDMKEFDRGARQALSIVSKKLVSGDLDDLEGLVESTTLAEIKQTLSAFSVFQRGLLEVELKDISFSFPYRIGVMLPDPPYEQSQADDNLPTQTRHVEITVVFHVIRGFLEKTKASENWSLRQFANPEERNNIMVCNYRFFRDFTKGVKNPSWIINMINHFLPADHRGEF